MYHNGVRVPFMWFGIGTRPRCVCACMHAYATEWGAGSWSMVVLTDLRDVASHAGQQLTVLRIRVTCSAPSVSRSDDILSLMSKVGMSISELHRAANQLPSPVHSHRKDYVMSRRGRPLLMGQGELKSVCSPSLLKETPLNPHRPPMALQMNTRSLHTLLMLWVCCCFTHTQSHIYI